MPVDKNKEGYKMKNWIESILLLGGRLDKIEDLLDNKMDELALDTVTSMHKLADKMFRIIEKKRKIVNFSVMHNMIVDMLSSYNLSVIYSYMDTRSYSDLAEFFVVSTKKAKDSHKDALRRSEDILLSNKVHRVYLENEYADVPFISFCVDACKKEATKDAIQNRFANSSLASFFGRDFYETART